MTAMRCGIATIIINFNQSFQAPILQMHARPLWVCWILLIISIGRLDKTMGKVTVEEVLGLAGWSKADAARVRKHEIVQAPVESTTERELAAGFAFLIKCTLEELEDIFLKSESKEDADDTIQQMGRMDEATGHLDFSSVKLLPDASAKSMVKAYLNCSPGDDLNLSQDEMKLFHALDKKHATQEQVEAALHKVLAKRLRDYQQKGLEGIAPYARKGKDFEPGKELLERTKKLKIASKVSPEFLKYQMEFPNSKPVGVKDTFGWINFKIDDKPTISLFHKSFYRMSDDCVMMCFRHFYVSRGHNSVQSLGGLFPVEDDKTLLFYASRTSTDLVAGFGGSAKKAMGSRIMGGRLKENFAKYRTHLEK